MGSLWGGGRDLMFLLGVGWDWRGWQVPWAGGLVGLLGGGESWGPKDSLVGVGMGGINTAHSWAEQLGFSSPSNRYLEDRIHHSLVNCFLI